MKKCLQKTLALTVFATAIPFASPAVETVVNTKIHNPLLKNARHAAEQICRKSSKKARKGPENDPRRLDVSSIA